MAALTIAHPVAVYQMPCFAFHLRLSMEPIAGYTATAKPHAVPLPNRCESLLINKAADRLVSQQAPVVGLTTSRPINVNGRNQKRKWAPKKHEKDVFSVETQALRASLSVMLGVGCTPPRSWLGMSIDSEWKPTSPDVYVPLVSTAYVGALLKEISTAMVWVGSRYKMYHDSTG